MLSCRTAPFATMLRLRRLSSAPHPSSPMQPDDVDVLTNPSEKYVDAFMKAYGNERTVFKKEDFALWQNSFDDYQFKLTCLKGTTTVVATSHFVTFKPLDESKESLVFMGFGWMDKHFRNPAALKIQQDICHEVVPDPKTNMVGHINLEAARFWHMMCGLEYHPTAIHNAADVGYRSFYDVSDMKMDGYGGEIIDSSGITIRNARDVPKRDIIEYDQRIHPYHREKYIISHMLDRDGFAKVAYSDKDGKVCGIGQSIIYENKMDCNIGPLYADEPRVAQTIFSHMLNDIQQSGKKVSRFEIRSAQMAPNSFRWIAPFLKCKPTRSYVCNFVYKHWAPEDIDLSKVYCPTHLQLFMV